MSAELDGEVRGERVAHAGRHREGVEEVGGAEVVGDLVQLGGQRRARPRCAPARVLLGRQPIRDRQQSPPRLRERHVSGVGEHAVQAGGAGAHEDAEASAVPAGDAVGAPLLVEGRERQAGAAQGLLGGGDRHLATGVEAFALDAAEQRARGTGRGAER